MAATSPQTLPPNELTERLLAERDAIANFVATVEALEARVKSMEARHGIASADIHAAIESGQLIESQEVCDWLMDYELLSRARSIAG